MCRFGRFVGWLLLPPACTPACMPAQSDDNVRWVEVLSDEEPCGGSRRYLNDAFAEMAYALGGAPQGAAIRYHWVQDGVVPCAGGSPACYVPAEDGSGDIYDPSALGFHTLAHAAHSHVLPLSRKLLHEGLAMSFDPRPPNSQMGLPYSDYVEGRVDEWLTWEPVEGDPNGYFVAWSLVSGMLNDEDIDTFVGYWESIPPDATPDAMRQGFEARYGHSVESALFEADSEWSCGRPWCGAAETVVPDGDTWTLQGGSCEDETVLGPDDEELIQRVVIDLETDSDLRVEVAGELIAVSFRACDDPCGPSDVQLTWEEVPGTVSLAAGSYEVTTRTFAEKTPTVVLTRT